MGASSKYYNSGVDNTEFGVLAAATTARTCNVDTLGADYATIRVILGIEKNTNATNPAIQLSESDDTVATNFATWDASFNRNVDNVAAAVATSHIDLRGRKRYIRVTVTPDTTTNGDLIAGVVSTLYKDVRTGTTGDYGEDVIIG